MPKDSIKPPHFESMAANPYASKCFYSSSSARKSSQTPPECAITVLQPPGQVKALFPAATGVPHEESPVDPGSGNTRCLRYFTAMNLSPALRVFTPCRGTSAIAMATLSVTGTEVIVSMPWTSMVPSSRVTFVMALRL